MNYQNPIHPYSPADIFRSARLNPGLSAHWIECLPIRRDLIRKPSTHRATGIVLPGGPIQVLSLDTETDQPAYQTSITISIRNHPKCKKTFLNIGCLTMMLNDALNSQLHKPTWRERFFRIIQVDDGPSDVQLFPTATSDKRETSDKRPKQVTIKHIERGAISWLQCKVRHKQPNIAITAIFKTI